jgi:TRAP-type C4-dicarboxylate transport system substrate-binding protein
VRNSGSESGATASSPATTEAPAESTHPATSEDTGESVVIRLDLLFPLTLSPARRSHFKTGSGEKTDGRVTIELNENATLGNDRDLIEGLHFGTVEMAGPLFPAHQFFKRFSGLGSPIVVENSEEGLQRAFSVMDGDIGKAMWASVENINIKGLFISYTGFRNMINTKRDVASPADLKGLKIRTMENSIHQAFYTAAGATPVALASSEAFTALQQGTIDGMDNVLDAMSDQGAFDVAKHLTLTEHFVGAMYL